MVDENELYEGWQFPLEGSRHEDVILDFNFEDYKLYALWGSVSSGKTVSSAQAWAALVRQTPKQYPLAMIGKTERTLEGNVLDPLQDFLGSDVCEIKGSIAYIYGHKVRLYGANDAKARPKIQGRSLYAWYGDEVTTWPEDFFMMALSRLRVGKSKAIMTMNPEGPYNWFHKQIIERADQPEIRAKLYHFTMDDNPFLPADYKVWISSLYVPGTVWHKRWIQGLWATAEGAVFPFLTDDPKDGFVISDLPNDFDRWLVAIDYGQDHPTTMGLYGFSPKMDSWILVKETYDTMRTNPDLSKDFGKLIIWDGKIIEPESVDIDPGGGGLGLINQLRTDYPNLYENGSISHAIKQNVNAELSEVASALYTHKFRYYAQCKRSISEAMNYRWAKKSDGAGKEEPVKVEDDGPDRDRYFNNRRTRL
jgi:PBSX family phage terminase large subunit